jgi:hypothetical protein
MIQKITRLTIQFNKESSLSSFNTCMTQVEKIPKRQKNDSLINTIFEFYNKVLITTIETIPETSFIQSHLQKINSILSQIISTFKIDLFDLQKLDPKLQIKFQIIQLYVFLDKIQKCYLFFERLKKFSKTIENHKEILKNLGILFVHYIKIVLLIENLQFLYTNVFNYYVFLCKYNLIEELNLITEEEKYKIFDFLEYMINHYIENQKKDEAIKYILLLFNTNLIISVDFFDHFMTIPSILDRLVKHFKHPILFYRYLKQKFLNQHEIYNDLLERLPNYFIDYLNSKSTESVGDYIYILYLDFFQQLKRQEKLFEEHLSLMASFCDTLLLMNKYTSKTYKVIQKFNLFNYLSLRSHYIILRYLLDKFNMTSITDYITLNQIFNEIIYLLDFKKITKDLYHLNAHQLIQPRLIDIQINIYYLLNEIKQTKDLENITRKLLDLYIQITLLKDKKIDILFLSINLIFQFLDIYNENYSHYELLPLLNNILLVIITIYINTYQFDVIIQILSKLSFNDIKVSPEIVETLIPYFQTHTKLRQLQCLKI